MSTKKKAVGEFGRFIYGTLNKKKLSLKEKFFQLMEEMCIKNKIGNVNYYSSAVRFLTWK